MTLRFSFQSDGEAGAPGPDFGTWVLLFRGNAWDQDKGSSRYGAPRHLRSFRGFLELTLRHHFTHEFIQNLKPGWSNYL